MICSEYWLNLESVESTNYIEKNCNKRDWLKKILSTKTKRQWPSSLIVIVPKNGKLTSDMFRIEKKKHSKLFREKNSANETRLILSWSSIDSRKVFCGEIVFDALQISSLQHIYLHTHHRINNIRERRSIAVAHNLFLWV